jgi:DNA-binding MarR family transcriptional regulator
MSIESEYLSEPGLSTLFTRIARISLLLGDFQHRCFEPYGLRFVDYSVIRVLELAGAPYQMSPTRLSEVTVRSTGGMTQILDRLERAGLVERSPDPSDRRKVIVGLTAKGLELSVRANRDWVAQKAELLSYLPSKDFKRLDRAVRDLLKLFTDDFDRHDSAAIESKTVAPPAPAPASRRVRPSRTAADPS